ncbi:MAG TPA: CBS domain-containing protein [Firmicutes bacterium]|nr:CBS domain-containing protein [Bacillota bacterium]
MLVRDVMTADPITVTEDTPIFEAMDAMRRHQFSRLPVTRKGRLIGIVTELDLMRVAPSAATTLSIWEQNELLQKMKVREVMTLQPITISPNDTVEEAARVMRDRRISGLPVVENDQVIGIVTERDLFDAFVDLMHGGAPGARLTIKVTNKVGVLADIARIISNKGINILAVAAVDVGKDYPRIIFKLATVESAEIDALVAELEKAGYSVVHRA